jgi:hypothetical protein
MVRKYLLIILLFPSVALGYCPDMLERNGMCHDAAVRVDFGDTGSDTGLGDDPFSTGGHFTAANGNAIVNGVNDNDSRLDDIEAIIGVIFGVGDGTYVDTSTLTIDELMRLDGVASALIEADDVDDTPVDGETAVPISSNYMYDHVNGANPHDVYMLESNIGFGASQYPQMSDTPDETCDETTVVYGNGTCKTPSAATQMDGLTDLSGEGTQYSRIIDNGDYTYSFVDYWIMPCRQTAPSVPIAGAEYCADPNSGAGWNPLSRSDTATKYKVIYDGVAYKGLLTEDGEFLVESIASGVIIPDAFCVSISDETTDLTTGSAKRTFRMPYAMTLDSDGLRASVSTAPVGSTIIIDVNEGGSTIMDTNKLSIDATEETSTTAATAAGITDVDLADDAEITIDIDQIGSGTAGKGAKVCFIGTRSW